LSEALEYFSQATDFLRSAIANNASQDALAGAASYLRLFGHNQNGKRLGDVKTGFRAACARAGLTDVSPHVLRHTCATWMMQRGVPKWDAAGFLGMTLATLERDYGHYHPEYLREAARAFS
jgi:integrase